MGKGRGFRDGVLPGGHGEGQYDKLPDAVRSQEPWTNQKNGEVAKLKPEYRAVPFGWRNYLLPLCFSQPGQPFQRIPCAGMAWLARMMAMNRCSQWFSAEASMAAATMAFGCAPSKTSGLTLIDVKPRCRQYARATSTLAATLRREPSARGVHTFIRLKPSLQCRQ